MKLLALPAAIDEALARLAALVEPIALLVPRLYVGWVFAKSGWLKLTSWDVTLELFAYEYHVPVLPPTLAAVVGTAGELGFGALVMLGLYGRLSAIGLFAVNAMAVISYRQVLLAEGFEAAFAQHVLWGTLLAALFVTGPGLASLDRLRATFGVAAPPNSAKVA